MSVLSLAISDSDEDSILDRELLSSEGSEKGGAASPEHQQEVEEPHQD